MSNMAAVKACMQCRTVKTKCRAVLGSPICERCTRKPFDCVSNQKKRGKKPGTKLYPTREDTSSRDEWPKDLDFPSEPSSQHHDFGRPVEIAPKANINSEIWTEPENLQPPGLFKRPMKGKFSLENILCASDVSDDTTRLTAKSASTPHRGDPIQRGLVSYYIATSLFQGFMKNLNPLICVLDVGLHTFQYVQERSHFLLTVILAAATKAFKPDLHPELYKYSEDLYMDSLRRGTKSTETIQAILIFAYWKKPDDTRSWSAVGYAIRLCMELGWHKLVTKPNDNSPPESRFEALERRNIERTWLVMFIHDRGSSFQTGKPWMIERSDFIESVNSWYKNSLSTSNGAAVCALATLRLTTADIIDVLNPQRPCQVQNQSHRVSSSLRMLKPQLEALEKHWSEVVQGEPCHKFIVSFYAKHVQLFLYSFPLEASLSSHPGGPLMDNEAFWITHTSAIGMLKAATHPLMSPLLSFVHDAIHVMVAYAAVFLIKLLLSVHQSIRQEVESSIIDTIKAAAQTFELQATPATFSCSLQARFLRNILVKYEKACGNKRATFQDRLIGNIGSTSTRSSEQAEVPVYQQSSQLSSAQSQRDTLQSQFVVIESVPSTSSSDETYRHILLNNVMPNNMPLLDSYVFDDERWESTFMNAGFHIGEGVFLQGLDHL